MMGTENLKNYVFWLFVGTFTLVIIELNDKYGPGNFRNFLTGKYLQPTFEKRVVMFLDMRSSTAIADALNELAYFELLRDFFRDVTPGVLKTGGDIYQYVGDEIVISWKLGTPEDNYACLAAYKLLATMADQLARRAANYKQQYGYFPEFKAGVHCGQVVVGEIGMIKRDISFSGDVVNTASRIQAKCNELQVDLLISEDLADRLDPQVRQNELKPLGKVALRGKAMPLPLYTLQ